MFYGVNISRVSERAIRYEIQNLELRKNPVIQKGIVGLGKNTRILMAEKEKFEKIDRLKAGDKVLSFNSFTRRCEEANVIDISPLTKEKAFAKYIILNSYGIKIELLSNIDLNALSCCRSAHIRQVIAHECTSQVRSTYSCVG